MTKQEMFGLMEMATSIAEKYGVKPTLATEVRVLHDPHCGMQRGGTTCHCDPDIEIDAKDENGEDCVVTARTKKGEKGWEIVVLRDHVN